MYPPSRCPFDTLGLLMYLYGREKLYTNGKRYRKNSSQIFSTHISKEEEEEAEEDEEEEGEGEEEKEQGQHLFVACERYI